MRRGRHSTIQRSMAIRHGSRFADPYNPTIKELMDLPPLTNLEPYPFETICESLGSIGVRRLTAEESASLLAEGDRFLAETPIDNYE